ncbi:MAG: hypothetical protein QOC99_586 [Acidobacteriota bacterium]|jgi:hypothetical protein|nr:hypothetical protein [Acidobacteriota bacterium]MDT7778074.1 hypothetical protein [Acidobacteriota bacterium]
MAKMQIKRVGIFSYAKITAVTCAAFGLIFGVLYGLIIIIFGAAMLTGRNTAGAGAGSIVVGLFIMIGFPLFYAILGFIMGAFGAVVYNVAAGFVGGIELELESVEDGYAAPPSPQWNAQQPGQQYQPGQQQYPY